MQCKIIVPLLINDRDEDSFLKNDINDLCFRSITKFFPITQKLSNKEGKRLKLTKMNKKHGLNTDIFPILLFVKVAVTQIY